MSPVEWKNFPGLACPRVVSHDHVVPRDQDLEESGRPMAGAVAEQGSTRVQTELPRNPIGDECPGGMDVAATIEMGADRGQPAAECLGVDQILVDQVLTVRRRDVYRIMTGDDQPSDSLRRPRNKLSGPLQLRLR
jgi:hypothetical protein